MAGAEGVRPVNGATPRLSGDIRHLIPKLGLRDYWYPALNAGRVGPRKPVKVSMLGEDICLFRGARGDVVAIHDICPHRGARLSEGDSHYRGTVACPYHGWVFDESGKNVAVLSEGPDSGVCGKPGTEAKIYPTRTLKGVVFVWIGESEPAPIEEDVPEEFFDDDALVLTGQVHWRCNWEVATELHGLPRQLRAPQRDGRGPRGFIARGAQGEHPIFVGNGFGGDVAESNYLRRNPTTTSTPMAACGQRRPTAAPGPGCSGPSPSEPGGRSHPRRPPAGAAVTICPGCSGPSSPTTSTRGCACRSRRT